MKILRRLILTVGIWGIIDLVYSACKISNVNAEAISAVTLIVILLMYMLYIHLH